MNLKRYLADTLSFGNFCCGIGSAIAASQSRFEFSLGFLLVGAAFDGVDGLAARKFGGTRFGVYADDIADGVNYGLAPGAALFFAIGGFEGAVIGSLFSVFTLGRLIYFTLNKSNSDPEYFSGVPSTVGGIIVLSSLVLFGNHNAFIGFMVGVACIQMVSFDTLYRHLGRALFSHRGLLYKTPLYLGILTIGGYFFGLTIPISIILIVNLIYGFLPVVLHFQQVIAERQNKVYPSEMKIPGG